MEGKYQRMESHINKGRTELVFIRAIGGGVNLSEDKRGRGGLPKKFKKKERLRLFF